MRTRIVTATLLGFLLSGCSSPLHPWAKSLATEQALATIAADAAWRVPGFLEHPQRLATLPLEKQLGDLPFTWSAIRSHGYAFGRVYLVHDPTSDVEPNLKSVVVLLNHDEEGSEAFGEVVTGSEFFPRVFKCLGEADPPRNDFFELCRL